MTRWAVLYLAVGLVLVWQSWRRVGHVRGWPTATTAALICATTWPLVLAVGLPLTIRQQRANRWYARGYFAGWSDAQAARPYGTTPRVPR